MDSVVNYARDKKLQRVFIEGEYSANTILKPLQQQVHYLKNVLRKRSGDEIIVFNGETEWKAVIRDKNVELIHQLRRLEEKREINLIFAPIKSHRIDIIFEKSTELGVTNFFPVITSRTIVSKINIQKAQSWVIEASEQCGRIDIPIISEPINLNKFLTSWPENKKIFFCDEDETRTKIDTKESLSILVGPEGGFSDEERRMLRAKDYIIPISLGKNILRAETACLCALSQLNRGL